MMNNWEVYQSGLDLHIYARTVPDLIAGSDGKREVCSPYIYVRTKPNLFLVVKIRIVTVSPSFLYNHTLVHEEGVQCHEDIAPTLVADACIALLQRLYDVGIALHGALAETVFQRRAVLLFSQFRKRETFFLLGLLEYIAVHDFGQCAVVDAEGERLEVPVAYMCRLYLADVPVLRALGDLQDGFRLVVQFRADMSPRIVIPLVQMQHGMNVQVVSA